MRLRVAVQERQRLLREGLRLFLAAEPSLEIVATVATARELLTTCAVERPAVVLLEVDAPDWDALKCVAILRREYRDLRIVGMCARHDRSLATRAALVGAHVVVPRNAGMRPIIDAVHGRPIDIGVLPEAEGMRPRRPSTLTPRELEVLSSVAAGSTTRETSQRLGISPKTVENHKRRIFAKLDVQNQAHAVAIAVRGGLLLSDAGFDGGST
jgi:DNA-binding NarL/FixJ family response regulator